LGFPKEVFKVTHTMGTSSGEGVDIDFAFNNFL